MKQPEAKQEFSRPLDVARVPKLGSHEKLLATAAECDALAKRLLVPRVHALTAELKAKPWRGGGLKVTGEAHVDLDQQSVVSLEVFRATVTIPVERYYMKSAGDAEDDGEYDIDPILQGHVDLGDLVAESIALELDPYPRIAGESFEPLIESDPADDDKEPNPFKVLQFSKNKT